MRDLRYAPPDMPRVVAPCGMTSEYPPLPVPPDGKTLRLAHPTPSHHAPGSSRDASTTSADTLVRPDAAGEAPGTPVVAFLDEAPTPAGPVHFATDIHGAVLTLQFIEGSYPRTFLDELVRDGYATTMRDDAKTGTVRRAIEAWTQGEAGALDALPIAWHHGTAWQEQVWRGLRTIPFGDTWTYGQLARALGRPTAVRAVARANATNRVPLIVPCHRVIGTDGTLTGFGGGLHLKARLLNHELRVMGRPQPWKA